MKYRKFGKLNWQASVLGFGAMRLPLLNSNPANIDELKSIEMIRYAIDHGVNYVDTAYDYHAGQSETIVGRALQDGYLKKVKVATKLPSLDVVSISDCDYFLNKQLERLHIDKVDFYLLHGLNKECWAKLSELDVLSWAEGAIADGRVAHLGFSFHDDFQVFKEIVDAYDNWTLCQFQYNYMDINYQAGHRGLQYANSKGIACVIMEPLRGGRLTKKPPQFVANLWASVQRKRTLAEWGLLWVWQHPEVSVVLSGMSKMEEVRENVYVADCSGPNILTADELTLIERVRETYGRISPVPCTGCGYCMPCSNGVQIIRIFELYNDAVTYDEASTPRFFYRGDAGLNEEQRADRCLECGDCVKACPQHINVPEWLKKSHALLGPRK